MILSDKTIRERVEDGSIGITPEPDEEQFQPASLDVRMGSKVYDPACDEMIEISPGEGFNLKPGHPVLAQTQDVISLPDDLAAQLTGRSSIGRRGVIVHKTAGWIDPGFRGTITLEMFNFSHGPQFFKPGERVAQLVFFPTDETTSGYDGQYQDQKRPSHGSHGGMP